ncbi:acyl-CoA dehydrogenase family protein [Duganella sp. HH105]|uniref:acyl-CoA dehydrogenase family protein n=1 Tax=Duganella sp. HH105 TaxID=1781067 RepID=UPI000877D514|nr:acyl-CoA dehydrogenase family protein [Duganella sp. HH105]OEZ63913.1 acyl-CoA dehydrogenase [Duganella sp. HH105]
MDVQVSPWMDAGLELYRDSVRRFVKAEVLPGQERWRAQRHVDRALWERAGALDLLLADVPEQYGGAGGSYAHMVVLWQELMAVGEVGFGTHVHSVAARYILNNGSEEQKQRYLPQLASGKMIAAIAITEPDAGSDLQAMRCSAVRDGDEYRINGAKTFISNGHLADLLVLAVKTDPAGGAKAISLLLVETRALSGYRVGPILDLIGRKSQDTCELFFDDVRVPAHAVLGAVEGRGLAQLMRELPYERTLLGVTAVAAIERAVALATDHAQQRKVFGKPLFELQNTRFKLAEAKTQAVVARVFIDWCIGKIIDGSMETDVASMAKWYLTDMQCRVIDDCLQLFGGYGYSLDFPIAQMYADARVQKIYGGANEVMKEIIAYNL